MLPIHKILHPTDFSPNSEYGFQLACALARDYGAHLILMHVKMVPTVVYGEFGVLPPDPEDEEERLRDRLTRLTPTNLAFPPEYHLVEGEPAEEIVRMAGNKGCNLIVMGTHGRTGLGRLLMGSVAEQVMRKAPCPVLTIKAPMAEQADERVLGKEPALA